ncbi:MAG: PAS domain S-box protein, partial [Gammaproteobacteria bacterium]
MKSPLSSSKEKSGVNSSANEAPLQYLYRSFLDAVSVGLWVSDKNGRVKFFNQSWLEFTGRSFEDEIDHEWDGSEIHPEDLANCLEIYNNNFKSGTPFEHEYRLLRHDGESRWVHEFVNPYFAEDNSHAGFVGTCIDITERKQAILLADQQLREKNKDLEQFAYVASHDLQEPLRKIQSFGELIKTRFSNDVPLQALDYINRMDKSASRMRVLIDDLLTFSRVSSRVKPFVKIELNKEDKVVISDLEVLLKETQGKVNVGELPVIDADISQIRQLMSNIINNGLKYHRKDVAPVIDIT